MKKLLLSIICALSALAGTAQTGVGVSNFKATQGTSDTTATFTVSWTSAGNDSVWVFVDYNTAGTMKRLPLTTVTASAGTVRRPNNSEWGAWVVAPAGAGAFATTVTLSSSTTYSYGSCAYAIPQPPAGEYIAYNTIKFAGTPPFKLTFDSGAETLTKEQAATTYTIPAGRTLVSFTDATRAPGAFKCTPPAIVKHPDSRSICNGTTQLDVRVRPAAAYQWYKDGEAITSANGHTSPASALVEGNTYTYTTTTYTATPLAEGATYTVTATIGACSATSNPAVISLMSGTASTTPGSTVTFAAFNPCMDATVGTTWYLEDTRAYGNNQIYKVRMMPDNRIWMVQDLKFGNCTESSWKPEPQSEGGTTITPTVAPGYVGHCRTSTATGAGFLYSWAGAMNFADVYFQMGRIPLVCTDANIGDPACRGICPEGWHIMTGQHSGDATTLYIAMQTYKSCSCISCLTEEPWEGVRGGVIAGGAGITNGSMYMWTSTITADNGRAARIQMNNTECIPGVGSIGVHYGMTTRCVRNY
jgi:uncharacterized protein (TIGR02145 family)